MGVAKRQRRRKAHKNGAKGNLRTRVRTSDETNSPICIGQAQGRGGDKGIKGRSQDELRPLLWGWLVYMP